MPRTLPISRSRARTVERTTSTTRLCFSSTTPVRTVKPKQKMPTRMRTAPMLATRKWRLVGLGLRVERRRRPAAAGRRPARPGRRPRRPGRPAPRRPTIAGQTIWATPWSVSSWKPDLAGPGQVGRDVDDDVDRPRLERRVGRGAVG